MRGEESLCREEPLRRQKPMRSALSQPAPATGLESRLVDAPDLARLPLAQLQAMRQAGREIVEMYRALKKAELNIVGEVLRDSLNKGETFYEFNHYPNDDVYDRESHAQYYYHAHRSETGEHGHFHCFLRPKGMPADVAPIDYPATDPWPQGNEALSHLVAIAMDGYGFPTTLFTTNRWVTAEAWYPAEQVIHMLDRFVIDHAFPSLPVNRWISAMFVLYRPHIEALLQKRDEIVWAWAATHPDGDVFEDRELDITSQMEISVEDALWLVELALAGRQG
ncbi:hypothetical protein TK5_03690 [Sideroxyarcus sp. TK5]